MKLIANSFLSNMSITKYTNAEIEIVIKVFKYILISNLNIESFNNIIKMDPIIGAANTLALLIILILLSIEIFITNKLTNSDKIVAIAAPFIPSKGMKK